VVADGDRGGNEVPEKEPGTTDECSKSGASAKDARAEAQELWEGK